MPHTVRTSPAIGDVVRICQGAGTTFPGPVQRRAKARLPAVDVIHEWRRMAAIFFVHYGGRGQARPDVAAAAIVSVIFGGGVLPSAALDVEACHGCGAGVERGVDVRSFRGFREESELDGDRGGCFCWSSLLLKRR